MAGAVAVVFSHFLVTDWSRISGMYDVPRYFGPNLFYMDYVLHRGEIPLWNPYSFCGTPFIANLSVAFFYPLNFVRSCLTFDPTPMKTHVGMALLMALQIIIAGVGTFLFAREQKLSYGAAFVAAFGFALSASFVRRACAFQTIMSLAWLPFILLALRRSLTAMPGARKFRYGLAAGLMMSLGLLGGSPQTFIYMSMAVGGFYGLYRLLHLKPEESTAKRRLFCLLASDFVVLALMGLVALAVAAAMLLPTTELMMASSRMTEDTETPGTMAQQGSLDFLYQCLIMYPGPKDIRQNMRGTGLAVVLLALLGLTHRRWRESLVYALLFLALCDLSLGPPFPLSQLVLWLTPYALVESSRAYVVACFPLAMLAGFGVDAVTTRWKHLSLRTLRSVALAAVGAATLTSLSHWIAPHDFLDVSKAVVYLPAAALGVALLGGWLSPAPLWRWTLAALVLAEIAVWNQAFVPHLVSGHGFTRLTSHADHPEPWTDNYRDADPRPQEWLYGLRPAVNGYSPLYIGKARQAICGLYRERRAWRITHQDEATVESYRGHLLFKRAFWLAQRYVEGALPGKRALFPSATTVFLENPGALDVPEVPRSALPSSGVSENAVLTTIVKPDEPRKITKPGDSTLKLGVVSAPPLHSVLRLEFTSDCRATISPMFREPGPGTTALGKEVSVLPQNGEPRVVEIPTPDFRPIDIRLAVKVQQSKGTVTFTSIVVASDPQDEDSLISIVERTANRVIVDLKDLPGPRILTFLDAAYPGWEAYVDSERVPILTADDAFKAVAVSGGSHRVEFVFRPRSVYAGVAASGFSLAIVLAAMTWLWHRERRTAAPPPLTGSPVPAILKDTGQMPEEKIDEIRREVEDRDEDTVPEETQPGID
ncbi:MAG TPA: hypothetical protein PLO37_07780 [Candidatus Hydrogenedentes bacterium]|nr:hypothetical protein [Candidatus Hydrogenedentota bacterium]HPG66730.1 hypothetical protein [Candidatus Hydrogenedentota bacterium]